MLLTKASIKQLSHTQNINLLDCQVTLSSLNRHAAARRADVGTPKVRAVAAAVARQSACCVEPVVGLCDAASVAELLAHEADAVIDAIDNVASKAALVAHCAARRQPLLVSCGSGARLDARPLSARALGETADDPLVRAIRRELRRDSALCADAPIVCVQTRELPAAELAPLPPAAAEGGVAPGELAVLPRFRVRIMPVYSPVPNAFGAMLAQQAIAMLLADEEQRSANNINDNNSHDNNNNNNNNNNNDEYNKNNDKKKEQSNDVRVPLRALPTRLTTKQLTACLEKLGTSEQQLKQRPAVALSKRDVVAAFEKVWLGRHSVAPNGKLTTGLVLVRWRLTRPLDRNNVVCVTNAELKKQIAALRALCSADALSEEVESQALAKLWGLDAVQRIDQRLRQF